MTGQPYRPRGPIYPMAEVEQVDRCARWMPLWFALCGFVAFALLVGGLNAWKALAAVPPSHERPASP